MFPKDSSGIHNIATALEIIIGCMVHIEDYIFIQDNVLTVLKLRFGYSGMRFQIRVNVQGSGTRISGYPLRTLISAGTRLLLD